MLSFIANFITWNADPMMFEFTIPNVNRHILFFILAFVLFCLPYFWETMSADNKDGSTALDKRKKMSPLAKKIMGFGLGISILSMILIGRFGQTGWSIVSTFLTYFIVIYIGISFIFDDKDEDKSRGSFDAKKWAAFIGYPLIAALIFASLLKFTLGLTMSQMWEMTLVSFVAALLCTPLTLETPTTSDISDIRHTTPKSGKADASKAKEKNVKLKYIISAITSLVILSFTFKFIGYAPFESYIDIPISVRWYGLMFAVGFLLGTSIVNRMFRHEGAPEKWVGYLLLFVIIATIVGARAGHVFFYEWDFYSQHPEKIIAFWEGGLASHGGTMAIIIAVYIYSYAITHRSPMWTFDRLVIPIALVGALIRIGNLMNSEIFGHATSLPWGFMFLRSSEWQQMYAGVACHPTQIYESLAYVVLFGVLMWMYWKKNAEARPGLIFGVFLTWLFTARLLIEFLKNPQVAFEESMILNMGQLLSLPFILAGIYMIVQALRRPKLQMSFPDKFSE